MLNKHLLFKANLKLEVFETNSISEELIREYNELKFVDMDGKKDYFEFFYWASKYVILNGHDYETFKGIVDAYKAVNSISEKDKELILLSFKINDLTLKKEKYINSDVISLIDNAINLCSELNINDLDTLLILYRLKLRLLLSDNSDMDSIRAAKIRETKNKVEEISSEIEEKVLRMSGKFYNDAILSNSILLA